MRIPLVCNHQSLQSDQSNRLSSLYSLFLITLTRMLIQSFFICCGFVLGLNSHHLTPLKLCCVSWTGTVRAAQTHSLSAALYIATGQKNQSKERLVNVCSQSRYIYRPYHMHAYPGRGSSHELVDIYEMDERLWCSHTDNLYCTV